MIWYKKLFTSPTANEIIRTPIINSENEDELVWKLTPAGSWSSKSSYKHCFDNLVLPPAQQPKVVDLQIVSLLNHVWKAKNLVPRVQTKKQKNFPFESKNDANNNKNMI